MRIRNGMPVPWSFQFELVEGCNYYCSFCGLRSIREKNKPLYRQMDIELLRNICAQIHEWRPRARIEINNHGEPTMHQQFHVALRIMRTVMPRVSIQVQSNMQEAFDSGKPLVFIKDAFSCGVNVWVADCYDLKIFEQMREWMEDGKIRRVMPDVQVVDFYYNNPTNLSAYHNHAGRKVLFIMDDLYRAQKVIGSKGRAKLIINSAGNTSQAFMERAMKQPPLAEPLKKPCSRVFREMTFGWNGIVPLCCYDWKNAFIFGKVPEQNIKEIWYSDAWCKVRQLLGRQNAIRNFSPCDVCDYNGGFRLGLLPEVRMIKTDIELAGIFKSLKEHIGKYKVHQYLGHTYHLGGEVYNEGKVGVNKV